MGTEYFDPCSGGHSNLDLRTSMSSFDNCSGVSDLGVFFVVGFAPLVSRTRLDFMAPNLTAIPSIPDRTVRVVLRLPGPFLVSTVRRNASRRCVVSSRRRTPPRPFSMNLATSS